MNKTLKVVLIVGIALILGGGLFYGAAYALGDKYGNKNIGDYSEIFNQTEDFLDFRLDASVAKVNIKVGAANEIKIDAQDIIVENLECGMKNNTFEVFYTTKWDWDWMNFSIFGMSVTENHSPVINIYIPQSMVFNNFSIDGGVGEYNIEWVSTDSFKVNGGVGKTVIKDSKIDKLKVDGGVGEYDITGGIGEMNVSVGVGLVKVSGSVARDIKIDGAVGEVRLDLAGNIDNYDIRVDGGVGTVKINGEQANNYRNSSAPYTLDINGGVGNITIDIK